MINDYVYLTADDGEYFKDTYFQMYRPTISHDKIPADLFFANTLPLRSVCLVDQLPDGTSMKYEIVIDDDFKKRLEQSAVSELVRCGEITMKDDVNVSMSLFVARGKSELLLDTNPTINGRLFSREVVDERASEWLTYALRFLTTAITIWYGIQISLLNPYVKDVFRTETIRKTCFNQNGKKRKSVVKYIRHHYLNPGALSPKTEAGQMLRKTMAWYVVGHWRHYQDGKTIFIQPYWKGPLRETKVCEPRERKVV